jgi:hypothetical protein
LPFDEGALEGQQKGGNSLDLVPDKSRENATPSESLDAPDKSRENAAPSESLDVPDTLSHLPKALSEALAKGERWVTFEVQDIASWFLGVIVTQHVEPLRRQQVQTTRAIKDLTVAADALTLGRDVAQGMVQQLQDLLQELTADANLPAPSRVSDSDVSDALSSLESLADVLEDLVRSIHISVRQRLVDVDKWVMYVEDQQKELSQRLASLERRLEKRPIATSHPPPVLELDIVLHALTLNLIT